MFRAFTIGRIAGIPVRIHLSLLLVLPLLAWLFGDVMGAAAELAGVPRGRIAGAPWLWGLGVAVALFASVLVHELAHALYARKKGGTVQGITLFLLGGVSEIPDEPPRRLHRAIMALGGPITSLILGAIFLGAGALLRGTRSFSVIFALVQLGYLNLIIGVFNLLPAYPMDGGRILRAVLEGPLGPERATRTAAIVGKVFAVLFALIGILTVNIFLILIGLLVYMGASAESRRARPPAAPRE